ncbi:hypothetical protein BDA96_05G131500 [Sorghum bicolor]|uniref:Cathepsin propeptide inhibitor domain-containing protein n=2 Tax=Sorghum bicolor TaxID=4558 RepID=A0A921QY77_SORBI|nr:uncharacterized protein LOC8068733 [Sorghum bicolor]EES08507.1 hypothetical protein SORBI_3005G118700 [Sorghum bicolor]KAG0529833.1 hypothetical protein BDA96_05G131500 [Sorghum bicolor]|eukprot:XP_002449519.1 uncharacterized protein LOC8068733 [Sorghum bicolor]
MARLHHLSLVPATSLLLLLLLPVVLAAASAAAEEPQIRISVQYPTEEEARWLDRWSEKYQAQGAASGFSVHPATDEESAYLNSIFDNGKKRAASGDHSHGGGGGGGFDGHIEFDDDDHPFGRIVVDTVHSRASSSETNDGDLQNHHEPHSHAEYNADDVKDL